MSSNINIRVRVCEREHTHVRGEQPARSWLRFYNMVKPGLCLNPFLLSSVLQ